MQRVCLDTVDSTMAAMDRLLCYSKLQEGSVVVAASQLEGRGMGENTWESEHGRNLLATFVFYPTFLQPSRQFLLNCFVSLAVRDLVSQQLPGGEVCIKWPNDIYLDRGKVAGLLIRHDIQGERIDRSLVGIGININQQVFRSGASNPVSLIQHDGRHRDLAVILDTLQAKLMHYYRGLRQNQVDQMILDYHQYLYQIGRPANYLIQGKEVTATIKGVNEYGLLILQDLEDKEMICDLKEVLFL